MTVLYSGMQEQREQRNWAVQPGKLGANTHSGARQAGYTAEAALHCRCALLRKRDDLNTTRPQWRNAAWIACVRTYNNL